MTKTKIDQIRTDPFSMSVGSGDNSGAIPCMIATPNRLLVVKERAIYQIMLADEIDPKRSNIDIPNAQQKILSVGFQSAIVQKTLIATDELLKSHFLPSHICREECLNIVFEMLIELVALEEIVVSLRSYNTTTETELEAVKPQDDFVIPSVPDLLPKFKIVIQRADHVMRGILQLIRTFLPTWKLDKKPYDTFAEQVQKNFPDHDFGDFSKAVAELRRIIWRFRNCVEHPGADQFLTVTNYRLLETGDVCTPSFSITHPEIGTSSSDVLVFWEHLLSQLVAAVEGMVAFLCSVTDESGKT